MLSFLKQAADSSKILQVLSLYIMFFKTTYVPAPTTKFRVPNIIHTSFRLELKCPTRFLQLEIYNGSLHSCKIKNFFTNVELNILKSNVN